jgi:hypothetical protein
MGGGAEVFPRLNAMALVGMSAVANAMSEEQRARVNTAVADESVAAVEAYVDGRELVFDLASIVGVAVA